MAWIELHQSLPGHRKIMRLRRALKIGQAQAIGHLCMLWLWCLDNCPDGDLSELMDCEIAEAAGYDKRPEDFTAALRSAGFVDANSHVHDWYSYAGKLIEKREQNANRMRQRRARADNVQRTCSARADNVHDLCTATVPNRTVPNRTQPKEEEEEERAHARDWNPQGDAPESPPADTIESYIAANLSSRVSAGMIDKLDALEADGATPELIRYAVDAACETSQGPPTWNLFETILRNWLTEGVRTVGEAKAAQERHRAKGGKLRGPTQPALSKAEQFLELARRYERDES